MKNSIKLRQKELEIKIFDKFISIGNFFCKSRETREPPEPDIFAVLENGKRYFELTDNTDEDIQKNVRKHLASGIEKDVPPITWFSPFPKKYRSKFKKCYVTNGFKCDLLIYFSLQPMLESDRFQLYLEDEASWIKKNQKNMLFDRIWFLDYQNSKIIFEITK